MPAYLVLTDFRDLTIMPTASVDGIETDTPGWIDKQLAKWSRWIDSRLIKRYAVPFEAPYPEVVTEWLTRIVTVRCFLKRGIDPNDDQWTLVKQDCDTALAEIAEAADSDTGKFELPMRADLTQDGITKGGPFGYSETSPYVWTDAQGDQGHAEDSVRRGTSG